MRCSDEIQKAKRHGRHQPACAQVVIALVFLLVETAIIAAIFMFPSHALELTTALILLALLALILMAALRVSPESARMP